MLHDDKPDGYLFSYNKAPIPFNNPYPCFNEVEAFGLVLPYVYDLNKGCWFRGLQFTSYDQQWVGELEQYIPSKCVMELLLLKG